MVLIIIISLFFFQDSDQLLSKRYNKKIQKSISRNLDIKEFELDKLEHDHGELYEIQSGSATVGILFVTEVAACNLGGCPSYEKIKDNKASEYFDMMLLLNDQKQILEIKILDYFSDFGYEITSNSYLKKFKGKHICLFSDQSDDIDAVSGATISSYALEGSLALLCDRIE